MIVKKHYTYNPFEPSESLSFNFIGSSANCGEPGEVTFQDQLLNFWLSSMTNKDIGSQEFYKLAYKVTQLCGPFAIPALEVQEAEVITRMPDPDFQGDPASAPLLKSVEICPVTSLAIITPLSAAVPMSQAMRDLYPDNRADYYLDAKRVNDGRECRIHSSTLPKSGFRKGVKALYVDETCAGGSTAVGCLSAVLECGIAPEDIHVFIILAHAKGIKAINDLDSRITVNILALSEKLSAKVYMFGKNFFGVWAGLLADAGDAAHNRCDPRFVNNPNEH